MARPSTQGCVIYSLASGPDRSSLRVTCSSPLPPQAGRAARRVPTMGAHAQYSCLELAVCAHCRLLLRSRWVCSVGECSMRLH